MRSGNLPGRYETNTVPIYTKITQTFDNDDTTLNVSSTAGFPDSGTVTIRNGSTVETINYSSKTSTTFAGVTRAKSGNASVNLTIASGSNLGTVANIGDLTNVQIGQRVISSAFADGTYVVNISGSQITFSRAATATNPTGVTFAPMSSTGQSFTYSVTAPVIVESAYPDFSPTVSHWGTSVIMDGKYDDDKSLVFTYGQKQSINCAAGDTSKFSKILERPWAFHGYGDCSLEIFDGKRLIFPGPGPVPKR